MNIDNSKELQSFLEWADSFTKEHKLKLKGWTTYDGDYFAVDYLNCLCAKEIIVLNKNLGEKADPSTFDAGPFNNTKIGSSLQEMAAQNYVTPWYYKGQGKIMTNIYLAEAFKVKNEDVVLDNFPITKQIVSGYRPQTLGEVAYHVHADWFGTYFLRLAALCGKAHNEVTFDNHEVYNLRQFVIRLRPKGCVLSCVSSDPKCDITEMNLNAVTKLFAHPELKYLKLLFVSKMKLCQKMKYDGTPKLKEEEPDHITYLKGLGEGVSEEIDLDPVVDRNVEWVLAYTK